jgi:hypothetical protein
MRLLCEGNSSHAKTEKCFARGIPAVTPRADEDCIEWGKEPKTRERCGRQA